MGAAAIAIKEATDTMRLKNSTEIKINNEVKAAIGDKYNPTPRVVATPLPPCISRGIEKQ